MWRWDQGRLLYFQFDVLRRIAAALVGFDGARLSEIDPLLRKELMDRTGMPFAPQSYTVIRNYKRVFECAFLATVRNGCLMVTDFAKELANEDGCFQNVNKFLFNYINRFRFPFPAFNDYDNIRTRIYPFCAIIKLLIARHRTGKVAKNSVNDIFHYIIANNCNGNETIDFYTQIEPKAYIINDTEERQIREMVIFVSQLSILKVYKGDLWLDIDNEAVIEGLLDQFLNPVHNTPQIAKYEEFMAITSISKKFSTLNIGYATFEAPNLEFIEGRRRRVEHFRVDRSPLLRKYFREIHPRPVCDMCKLDLLKKYPWTDYLLEVHHLLPLSSGLAITAKGTSLDDIVGLCPSCHRSIHIYYSKWLRKSGQDDFCSPEEAMDVYLAASKEIA